jgi:hypothetical protein
MWQPRIRLSIRQVTLLVAAFALLLLPVHYWVRGPYYTEKASFHGMMTAFCEYEADLMRGHARACLQRAETGARWDDPSEEAENLKCCPYPNDLPAYGSWAEQAAIWERAAAKAIRAARWHSRMSDIYSGW